MELKIIRREEEFNRIQPEWDELVATQATTPLPMTHNWLQSWWNAFSAGMQMEFRCAYYGSALVGIAPLVRSRERYRGVPVTFLKLAANGHSPYSGIIVDPSLAPEHTTEVLLALTHVASNEIGLFFKVDRESELKRFLVDRAQSGHERVLVKPSLRTPIVDIDRSWEEFYQSRPRSLKKSLNHKLNRFRNSGEFTIDSEKVTEVTQPIIDELVSISANSWKSSIGNDLRSNQRSRRFLLNLVETFGRSGALRAWIVRNKDTPVAFELHLTCDDVVYPIRADYDDQFKSYSPGSVLEYSALKYLFESGLYRQYYTCADDYWYLSKWTTDYRNLCSIELFGDSYKLRALYFVENRIIPLIKKLIKKQKRKGDPLAATKGD